MMTMIDIELFKNISVVDFLEVCEVSQGTSEQFVLANNNMQRLVVRTNCVATWMESTILSNTSQTERIKIARKFLQIAKVSFFFLPFLSNIVISYDYSFQIFIIVFIIDSA